MLHERFQQAENVMNTLMDHGFECYFVGGSVRDFLLNLPIRDVDIATNAKPEDMIRIFPRTVPVGIDHGTVLILDNNNAFEVTTYRIEDDYDDFRHPNRVEFVNDITLDLSRRDFTINAMAMDMKGRIIDPFDGQKDLKLKKIKTVGSAENRFNEDPLRMLRGLRFTSQLGFNLDEEIIESIQSNYELLEHISVERITEELIRLFAGPFNRSSLPLMLDTNIYLALPIFKNDQLLIKKIISTINRPIEEPALLIALFHLIDPSVSIREWALQYKLSNTIKKGAIHLVHSYLKYNEHGLTNEVIYHLKKQWLIPFSQLVEMIDQIMFNQDKLLVKYDQLPIKNRNELVITGDDFLKWFPNKKRGKWVGDMLNKVEALVVENKLLNDYKAIEGVVKTWSIPDKK